MYETIIVKLIDKLPASYLMFLITCLVFYYVIHKLCKVNAKLLLRYFSKIKLQNTHINEKLDRIEEKISDNTARITKLETKKRGKQ